MAQEERYNKQHSNTRSICFFLFFKNIKLQDNFTFALILNVCLYFICFYIILLYQQNGVLNLSLLVLHPYMVYSYKKSVYFLTWHKKKELLFLHFIFLLTIFLSSSAFSSSKQFLFPSRKCYHMLLNIHFFFAKSLRFACKKSYGIQFSYVLSLKFIRH